MLDNASYTYIKLLHDLSRIAWYLENHGKTDCRKAGHVLSEPMLNELRIDVEKHMEKLKAAIKGLANEGKF